MKARAALVLAVLSLAAAPIASAQDGGNRFGGSLDGYQEVGATGTTISTTGNGRFDLLIDEGAREVHWQLSYGQLEGGAVLQAHIHLGMPAIAGGITVFLCTNAGNAPGAPAQPTQPCPQPVGSELVTISGTFTPNDVVGGAAAQGLAPGEFDELLRAIRAGATYANVHTQNRGNGEIRGQLGAGHSH